MTAQVRRRRGIGHRRRYAARVLVLFVRLRAALEPFLEPLLILRDELARLPPRERCEKLAEQAVTLEVELEGDLGAALARRLDRHRADRPHRAVDAPERRLPGRLVLGDLVGHRLLAAGCAADVGGAAPNAGRALGLTLGADDLRLPLAVTLELVDVPEHLLRAARDLDALHDFGHAPDPRV